MLRPSNARLLTPASWAAGAAMAAISSPLLETPVDGAQGILLGITGGPGMSLIEVTEAAQVVADAADPLLNPDGDPPGSWVETEFTGTGCGCIDPTNGTEKKYMGGDAFLGIHYGVGSRTEMVTYFDKLDNQ